MERRSKHQLILEVVVVTLILVVITSILHSLRSISFVLRYYSLIFAVLFLYAPVFVLHRRGEKVDFLDVKLAAYFRSFMVFLVAAVIVFPLFFLAAHGWEKIIYGAEGPKVVVFPDFWKVLAFQFIMVALPEEFFFRGYVHGTLNRVFHSKWRILGVRLGWSWILTSAIFAASHSVVMLQWWHFAIFFPGLLFGYLKEKTGTITAPILFHGTANMVMSWIGHMYN